MTDNNDEEMRWSPSLYSREREAVDFSMMAHDLSISRMPVVSPVLGEEKGGLSKQVERRKL